MEDMGIEFKHIRISKKIYDQLVELVKLKQEEHQRRVTISEIIDDLYALLEKQKV